LFSGNTLLQGYPKRLTELGLPEELDHVDAAAVWGHNSATYIFSGTMYWKYDNKTDKMELDYPRDMSIWRGVGYNINAAFQWHDGKRAIVIEQHLIKYSRRDSRGLDASASIFLNNIRIN